MQTIDLTKQQCILHREQSYFIIVYILIHSALFIIFIIFIS